MDNPWPQLQQEPPDLGPIPTRHAHPCTRDLQSAGHSSSGRDRRAPCVFLPVPRSPQAWLGRDCNTYSGTYRFVCMWGSQIHVFLSLSFSRSLPRSLSFSLSLSLSLSPCLSLSLSRSRSLFLFLSMLLSEGCSAVRGIRGL